MNQVPIRGFPMYRIDEFGNVFSVKRNKYLHQQMNKGYKRVSLCKCGKAKYYLVHRLVAQAFIPNPENLPQVNHKDENKSNNHISNLEWCTNLYNANYGTRISRMVNNHNYKALTQLKSMKKAIEVRKKSILQFNINGILINKFESIADAEKKLKINHSNIVMCAMGKRKSAGGYVWKYA